MKRNILIAGATGKQGSALIRALLHPSTPDPDIEYHVLALTRKIQSPGAQSLVDEEGEKVTLVEGDLNSPSTIRKIFEDAKTGDGEGGVWGVYVVLQYPGLGANADAEEAQGKVTHLFSYFGHRI